jgi:hypothetical protein
MAGVHSVPERRGNDHFPDTPTSQSIAPTPEFADQAIHIIDGRITNNESASSIERAAARNKEGGM